MNNMNTTTTTSTPEPTNTNSTNNTNTDPNSNNTNDINNNNIYQLFMGSYSQLPPLNFYPIPIRLVNELHLPSKCSLIAFHFIYPLIKHSWTDRSIGECNCEDIDSLSTNNIHSCNRIRYFNRYWTLNASLIQPIDSASAQAIAFVVVALKLVYTLDDNLELYRFPTHYATLTFPPLKHVLQQLVQAVKPQILPTDQYVIDSLTYIDWE